MFRGSDIKDLTVYESKKSDFVDPAVVTAQPARGGEKGGKSRNAPSVQQAFNKFERCVIRLVVPFFFFFLFFKNKTKINTNPSRQQQGGSMYDDWQHNDRGGKGGFRNDRHDRHRDDHHQQHGRMERFTQRGGRENWHERHHDRNDRHQVREMHGKGGKGFGGGKSGGRGNDRHQQNRRGSNTNNRPQNRTRENPLAAHTGMNFKVDEKKAQAKRKSSGLEDEFDFEKGNEKMDMDQLKSDSNDKTEVGYDKSKSFFDSLSCETTEKQSGEGGRYEQFLVIKPTCD